jgi:hypothetical protein
MIFLTAVHRPVSLRPVQLTSTAGYDLLILVNVGRYSFHYQRRRSSPENADFNIARASFVCI